MDYLLVNAIIIKLKLRNTLFSTLLSFQHISCLWLMFRQWKPTVKTNVVAETCAAIKYSLRGKQLRGAKRSPLEDIVGLI